MIKFFNNLISFGIFLIPLATIHLATKYDNVVAKYIAYGYNILFICSIPVSITFYFVCKRLSLSATKKPSSHYLISKFFVVLLTVLYMLLLFINQWYWSTVCWFFGGVYTFMYINTGEKYSMQTEEVKQKLKDE